MNTETERKMRSFLINIVSDGFNRSIGALAESGAVDLTKMRREYRGVGSKSYDLVTVEIEQTVEYAMPHMRRLVETQDRQMADKALNVIGKSSREKTG